MRMSALGLHEKWSTERPTDAIDPQPTSAEDDPL